MSLYPHCLMAGCLALILCLAAGCGGTNYTPARAADPGTARQTLATALDAWKSGAPSNALASRTPQVFVGDEDWSRGQGLKDYKLIGNAEPYGNNLRFQVGLKLTQKAGGPAQKIVRYLVATDPVLSVTRDDRPE